MSRRYRLVVKSRAIMQQAAAPVKKPASCWIVQWWQHRRKVLE
jgi:hypothetical protein